MSRIDMVGKRFGRLVVLKPDSYKNSHNHSLYWECQCDCGNIKRIIGQSLRNGSTTSCGCAWKKTSTECKWWKGHGEISGRRWTQIRTNAERRNIPFLVSKQYAWELFLKQDRRCAISGLPIRFETQFTDWKNATASLDRIDNRLGYTENNVQWTHKLVNIMRWTMGIDEFVSMCRLVVDNQIKVKIAP